MPNVLTTDTQIAKLRHALSRGDDRIEIELLNYRKDGTSFINALLISAIRGEDGRLLYWLASQEDITLQHRAKELEASERRLLKEVDHRTLNALALVQSIVRLSRAEDVEHLSRSINGRVHALALTHRLLAERRWRSVSLTDLIDQLLAAHGGADRVVVDRQDAELVPQVVQPLGLVIHELISNARVHGALAADAGKIELKCIIENDALVIQWREPIPSGAHATLTEGFGMQIIHTVVEHQLGGARNFDVANDLLEVTIVVPRAIFGAG
ncbi:HWE histidine kinase domain-containing protein [Sphingorhabdus sp.]|uniref:HWE histidine kinase domain-containing protein n=1 Tax=Sphingorhabdus sp. TaxID=1902408 RepID=UPI00391C7433